MVDNPLAKERSLEQVLELRSNVDLVLGLGLGAEQFVLFAELALLVEELEHFDLDVLVLVFLERTRIGFFIDYVVFDQQENQLVDGVFGEVLQTLILRHCFGPNQVLHFEFIRDVQPFRVLPVHDEQSGPVDYLLNPPSVFERLR